MDTQTAVDSKQVSNGAAHAIEFTAPYVAEVEVIGVAPLLFHAWNIEAIEDKGKAPKNSKAKKTDDVESYVYRTNDGLLGIPGRCFRATLVNAGRYFTDPRSPRKSMMDLIKAGIIGLDVCAPFSPETEKWDYEDKQRVTIQRQGITRVRPAMKEGWRVKFNLLVNTPEYFPIEVLSQLITTGGRQVGLLDFRPTYGRFTIVGLKIKEF